MSHFLTLCRFTLFRITLSCVFDRLSFDQRSFTPMPFDPISVNLIYLFIYLSIYPSHPTILSIYPCINVFKHFCQFLIFKFRDAEKRRNYPKSYPSIYLYISTNFYSNFFQLCISSKHLISSHFSLSFYQLLSMTMQYCVYLLQNT